MLSYQPITFHGSYLNKNHKTPFYGVFSPPCILKLITNNSPKIKLLLLIADIRFKVIDNIVRYKLNKVMNHKTHQYAVNEIEVKEILCLIVTQ